MFIQAPVYPTLIFPDAKLHRAKPIPEKKGPKAGPRTPICRGSRATPNTRKIYVREVIVSRAKASAGEIRSVLMEQPEMI